MAEKKSPRLRKKPNRFRFLKKIIISGCLGGIVIITLGLILMVGGKSDDPNQFYPDQVYSTTRITIAPLLILAGFVIEIFAIFRKPRG